MRKDYSKILDKILNEDQSKKIYKPDFVMVKDGAQSLASLVRKTAKKDEERYMNYDKEAAQHAFEQNANEKSGKAENSAKGVRLFGFIMLLTGLGASSSLALEVGYMPLWGRIIFILVGLTFLFVPNKDLKEVKLFKRFYRKK